MEAVGKDGGLVGHSVAVRILQEAHAIVDDLVAGEFFFQMLPVHGNPVGDGAASEIVVEPVHMSAVVGDAMKYPERLGDVAAPLLVEAECDRVGQQWLGSKQL